ncbi:MAG: acyl-CoA dehydrogenase family protein, partial [Candidatus Poseidoniales archaeon]|nr:acyl-CoA dehydrogenase family protein [Candidatus Poseidoniales archaeon]
MVYEALDFYDLDSQLTDEEIMVRDMVRDWVEDEVLPKIEKACSDGVFPDEWRVALGEMGVLGAPLEGYGCPGLSYVAYGVICRELERGDSGLRSFA